MLKKFSSENKSSWEKQLACQATGTTDDHLSQMIHPVTNAYALTGFKGASKWSGQN